MRAGLRCALGVLLAAASIDAMAVQPPGDVTIRVSHGDFTNGLVLVSFTKFTTDPVHFALEITLNGVNKNPMEIQGCVNSTLGSLDCSGADAFSTDFSGKTGVRVVHLGQARPDTDYCVRMSAVAQSGGAPAWAPQRCMRTPKAAIPPAAPPVPTITLLDPGTDGGGQVGYGTPGRVLVEWTAGTVGIDSFRVDRATAGRADWQVAGTFKPDVGVQRADMELIDTIRAHSDVPSMSHQVSYRLCAINAGGTACSALRTYPRLSAELLAKSPRALVLLGAGVTPKTTTLASPATRLAPLMRPAASAVALQPRVPVVAGPSVAPPVTRAAATFVTPATQPALDWAKTAPH